MNVSRSECCSVGEVGAGESAAMAMAVGETSDCVRLRNDEGQDKPDLKLE